MLIKIDASDNVISEIYSLTDIRINNKFFPKNHSYQWSYNKHMGGGAL